MGLIRILKIATVAGLIASSFSIAPLMAQENSMSDGYVLLKAIKDKDYGKLQSSIQKGANVNARNYKDGESALYMATTMKDTVMVTFLLAEKAKTDVPKKSTGETPLMVAVRLKSQKIVDMLIGQRANVNLGDRSGETALYKAVRSNNRQSVKALLAANADWSIADNTGRTPLDLAREDRRLRSMIKLLEDAGAEY